MNTSAPCPRPTGRRVGGACWLLLAGAFLAWPAVDLGLGAIPDGLVGHWPLNEGVGTTADDASTNGLTGALTGSPLPSWVTPGKVGAGALTEAEIQALPELAPVAPEPIVFRAHPTNQTVNAGDPVRFEAVVQGSPPYFIHWLSNGVEIPGASQLTYFIPAATTNLNGTRYAVTVSNLVSDAASSNAVLTVVPGAAGLVSAGPVAPRLFRVYEVVLGAALPGLLPYTHPGVTATFTHASGTNYHVRGFWDGANLWRVRFAPTLPGVWNWSTASTDPGLNGVGFQLHGRGLDGRRNSPPTSSCTVLSSAMALRGA